MRHANPPGVSSVRQHLIAAVPQPDEWLAVQPISSLGATAARKVNLQQHSRQGKCVHNQHVIMGTRFACTMLLVQQAGMHRSLD